MELFDYLRAMTVEKQELNFNDPEISKGYDVYIINRYISMNENFVHFVNEVLNTGYISKSAHYSLLKDFLPKQKIYFNYIKKSKNVGKKEKLYIADYFNVGLKEAELYSSLLSEQEIKELMNKYIHSKNKLIEL